MANLVPLNQSYLPQINLIKTIWHKLTLMRVAIHLTEISTCISFQVEETLLKLTNICVSDKVTEFSPQNRYFKSYKVTVSF